MLASDLAWFLNLVLKSSAVTPIVYGLVICCNFGLIYHAFCEAFTFDRAFVGLSAVALSRVLCVAYVRLSRVFI